MVAVVDTGIQMNHPDIKGSPNLAPGFDMVSDPIMGNDGDGRDARPQRSGRQVRSERRHRSRDSFHGTHVAGTIGVAATNNAAGVAGGAWNVTIVPVRALGRCGGKLSDINDGIRWAAGTVPARDAQGKEVWNSKPADIINLSIGLFGPCPASMQAAINDAVAAGAIVVSAAGNARVDTQYFAPGGCQNVISVAANDARGVLTPYSNFGANVAIMAPGGDMARDDDNDGRPDGILSTKYSKNCTDPANPSAEDRAVLLCIRERDLDGGAARFGGAGPAEDEIPVGGAIGAQDAAAAGDDAAHQPAVLGRLLGLSRIDAHPGFGGHVLSAVWG